MVFVCGTQKTHRQGVVGKEHDLTEEALYKFGQVGGGQTYLIDLPDRPAGVQFHFRDYNSMAIVEMYMSKWKLGLERNSSKCMQHVTGHLDHHITIVI